MKLFGTPFRRALEMVRLEPTDCFPLATYKIKAALAIRQAEIPAKSVSEIDGVEPYLVEIDTHAASNLLSGKHMGRSPGVHP